MEHTFCVELVFELKKKQKTRKTSKYIDWFELENNLVISIDGQNGHGKIIKPNNTQKEQMDEQETSGI
jgi:hypothetical protein